MKRETARGGSSARNIKRRTFIKAGAAAVAGAATLPGAALAAEPAATVVVVHGTDIAKMVEAGIAKMGGWDKFFKPGVGKITIPENTCQPEKETFETSGANGALKGTGAKLYRPKRGDFTSVSVPKGKVCQEAKVSRDLVEADCLVNMPVAKHHGGATLSLSMKNWMGAVDNSTRRAWHRNGLHQCIADFSTFLKPALIVIDATRIMLDHGPQGPGKLAHPHEIIFATDPVAADTYAASLFGKTPDDVPHIKIAAELGVGCADLAKIKVERIEA